MRTIKFRGKNLGIWVYGSLEVFSDENKQYARIKFDEPYTDEELGITIPVGHDYLVDPETVGQFTGLYDKNGKEIYEGDILQTRANFKGVVMWNKSGNFYINDDKELKEKSCENLGVMLEYSQFEVIGNIHDGKEDTK